MTRLRGLVALLVIVGLVVGVPWLLVRYGDWPITGIPGLDDVRQSFDTVVSDQMVFGVLTLAAWVVWALFMVSLVVEAVAAIRCRDAPRITLAAPMQRGTRVLVAMIVLAFAVHQSATSVAGAARGPAQLPPPRSPVIAEFRSLPETAAGDPGSSHSAEVRPMSDGLSNLAPTTITVDPGDSAWSIAEARLGDGMRWRELWDLNRTRPQPDGRAWIDPQLIRPGWILVLPAEAQRPLVQQQRPRRSRRPAVHVVEPATRCPPLPSATSVRPVGSSNCSSSTAGASNQTAGHSTTQRSFSRVGRSRSHRRCQPLQRRPLSQPHRWTTQRTTRERSRATRNHPPRPMRTRRPSRTPQTRMARQRLLLPQPFLRRHHSLLRRRQRQRHPHHQKHRLLRQHSTRPMKGPR